MGSTSSRLLQVLAMLQARGDWLGADLARRLGITERTVRRDIERLRELGYTIDSTPGRGGGYRLGPGSGLPPLLLGGDEAVAVAVALRSAAVTGVGGLDESAMLALVKLERSLPHELRRRVDAVQAALLTVRVAGPSVDVDVLITAASAVRDHQQLSADYTTHRGTTRRRLLEPHRVVRVSDRWFLVAYDVELTEWRTFRLDRLVPRLPLGKRFEPHPYDDAHLVAALGEGITNSPYRYRTRLTTSASLAEVGETVGPTRAQAVALDDGTTQLTGGGNDLEEMALWIMRLPFPVVVHEPSALLPHLRRLARRATDAATGLGAVTTGGRSTGEATNRS